MPESNVISGTIDVEPGITLTRASWPVHDARANILIVHGYAEYGYRYQRVAERLNERGYGVYAYDHRGHGKSPGTLGQIPSFNALIEDLAKMVEAVRSEIDPQKPLFIWGHSMGGLVTSAYTIRHQPDVAGIVLTSPGVKSDDSVSAVLKLLAPIIAKVLPKMPVHELDPNGISRDEHEVKLYVEDPLVYHGKILAQTGHQLVETIKFVESNFHKIDIPVYVLHGTKDRLVSSRAGEAIYEGMSSSDKTLKLYDGGYHELFNDTIRDEFYEDLFFWLDARS